MQLIQNTTIVSRTIQVQAAIKTFWLIKYTWDCLNIAFLFHSLIGHIVNMEMLLDFYLFSKIFAISPSAAPTAMLNRWTAVKYLADPPGSNLNKIHDPSCPSSS